LHFAAQQSAAVSHGVPTGAVPFVVVPGTHFVGCTPGGKGLGGAGATPGGVHFAIAAGGVHSSDVVPPQLLLTSPTGVSPPNDWKRSRPKNQHTALKWPGQPPPMDSGEATDHGCSTKPRSAMGVEDV